MALDAQEANGGPVHGRLDDQPGYQDGHNQQPEQEQNPPAARIAWRFGILASQGDAARRQTQGHVAAADFMV